MKCKIVVRSIKWAGDDPDDSTDDDATFIEFSVYKKGLFGGLKEVRDFEGSCLYLSHGKDGEIDLDLMFIQDGNFQAIAFDPLLVIRILQAALHAMPASGDKDKAQIIRSASIRFFRKHYLKKEK